MCYHKGSIFLEPGAIIKVPFFENLELSQCFPLLSLVWVRIIIILHASPAQCGEFFPPNFCLPGFLSFISRQSFFSKKNWKRKRELRINEQWVPFLLVIERFFLRQDAWCHRTLDVVDNVVLNVRHLFLKSRESYPQLGTIVRVYPFPWKCGRVPARSISHRVAIQLRLLLSCFYSVCVCVCVCVWNTDAMTIHW